MRERTNTICIFLALHFCLVVTFSFSQKLNADSVFVKGKAVIIFTTSKQEKSGIVERFQDSLLVLRRGQKDSVVIPVSEITRAYLADENNFFRGRYIHPDRQYMFNATFAGAFALPPKTAWIRISNGGFSVHYAFSRVMSMSYFSTAAALPVSATLRLTLPLSEHLHISPESGIMSASWVAPKLWMWTAGAKAGQGGSVRNISVGGGYAEVRGFDEYVNLLQRKYSTAYIIFGLKQRLSRKFGLSADGWFINRPRIIAAGCFLNVHRARISQWSFGALFFHARILSGTIINVPVPVVQWNTKF